MNSALCLRPFVARYSHWALLLSGALLLISGCSVFGGASVEEAPYEIVQKESPFEIREYAPVVVAETRVTGDYKKASNTAFRRLFAYISGENQRAEDIAMTAPVIVARNDGDSAENIAMTAPVTSQREGDSWRLRFVLPAGVALDTAPRPLNPEVNLAEVPARRVATIRYAGLSTDSTREDKLSDLVDWMQAQGLVAVSEPRWAGYNPPWTLPPFRRNEVLIDIAGP